MRSTAPSPKKSAEKKRRAELERLFAEKEAELGYGNLEGERQRGGPASLFVAPGLTRGPAFIPVLRMDREHRGGWVYIMADRYRGTMYVGVTSDLARRVFQHRSGTGSDFCQRYGLDRLVWAERGETIEDCIAHEKRVKRWRREWKFALIEKANPDWLDLYGHLI